MIRGGEVLIHPDFKKFLSDRDNKEWMFELIKQVLIENVAKLANRVVYFAR